MLKQQQSLMPDPSRLQVRESQLRSHLVGSWMKATQNRQELLERCLDYIYRDHPKHLAWSLDILDGDSDQTVMARILREARVSPVQAENIYRQIRSTIARTEKFLDPGAEPGRPAARAGLRPGVAHAGVASLGYSEQPEFVLVSRPSAITACAILLFFSAAMTALFVLGNFAGADAIVETAGTVGTFLSITFTALCGWGYWTMKKWAVLLYALEPIIRYWMGMSQMLVAIPLVIAAFGILHFREMTWK